MQVKVLIALDRSEVFLNGKHLNAIKKLNNYHEIKDNIDSLTQKLNNCYELFRTSMKGPLVDEELEDMINIGVKDYKKRVSKTHSFESNILKGFAQNGGVKGMKGMKGKLR